MKKIVLTIAIVLGSICLNAQPVPPPSQNGHSGDQPGGGAPIDGGVSILLAMGAIYGSKKVFQFKNKEIQN